MRHFKGIILRFIVILIAIASFLQAQGVYTSGNLTITADDKEPSNVTAITRITGNLTIGGTIATFPDFADLEVVEGNIIIRSLITSSLTELNNIFPALKNVGGAIEIGGDNFFIGNRNVVTISGFSSLTRIEGNLLLGNNPALTTLSGFDALTHIGGIQIIMNELFANIPSFDALTRIEGTLFIEENNSLTTLPSFSALTHIEGDLSIQRLILTSISGFAALDSVGNDFSISYNSALTNLSGFAALNSVGNDFWIFANTALTTLSGGFDVLTSIGRHFTIDQNDQLSSCCGLLRFVDGTVAPGGNTTIANNVAGCNSANEIIANCPPTMLINDDSDIPSNVATITRIDDNLTIGGTITTFPNFAALEVVEGNLRIDNITTETLTALTNIFPVLDTIRGNLIINNNEHLQTITGFTALDSVGTNLRIVGNDALTNLPSFSALTRIGGDFSLQHNGVLSSCCVLLRFVNGTVAPGGSTDISNNVEGCNSEAEIIADCPDEETDEETGDATLGLPSLANNIRFYPNPASQNLYIEEISQETSLIIRTLAGKTLLRTTLHQNQAIDLAFIPQGTYILTLQNAQEQITRRLVIGI